MYHEEILNILTEGSERYPSCVALLLKLNKRGDGGHYNLHANTKSQKFDKHCCSWGPGRKDVRIGMIA